MKYLVLLLLAGSVVAGGLKVEQQTEFIVENDYYRLVIDTARGGSIRSFIYKPFDISKDWIYAKGGGLLQDMIWQQRHPGELQDHPYEYRIVEQSARHLRIELWRAFRQLPYPGLVMRKEIDLRADSPAIRVRMTLENTSEEDVFPGAWVQNRFFGGGNRGVPVSFRPSYLGIRMSYFEGGRGIGDEFVRRPAAGWAATFDRESGAGFLGLVDYNYLQQHYSCLPAYTMEFFFDRVLVRASQSWTTAYMLVPVTDMSNCYYADERVYVTASQAGDQLTFAVHPTSGTVAATMLSVSAVTSDRSAELGRVSATFDAIGAGKAATISLTVPGIEKQPVILKLAVVAEGVSGEQEFMYYTDSGGYHLQESAVTYRAELPRKVKPELMEDRNLRLEAKSGLQVFYAYGLWHDMNRVKEALTALDPAVVFDESIFQTGTLGHELTRQPLLAEELLGYDLVVLNNVGAEALGEAGEIAVEQYVRAGGSLLVCGGLYSLGKSRWHESVLAEVLPFSTLPFWDIHRLPAFTAISGVDGVAVQWIQQPKELRGDAAVLLRAGEHPLLITGGHGRGKVVVWLGTPMGSPPPNVVPYWESPSWVPTLSKILSQNLQEVIR